MKKILFWAFICLSVLIFVACENNNTPLPNEEQETVDDTQTKEDENNTTEEDEKDDDVGYCKVLLKVKKEYSYEEIYYQDIKIVYEGGSGNKEGTYMIPRATEFKVSWKYYYKTSQTWKKYEETVSVKSSAYMTVYIWINGVQVER